MFWGEFQTSQFTELETDLKQSFIDQDPIEQMRIMKALSHRLLLQGNFYQSKNHSEVFKDLELLLKLLDKGLDFFIQKEAFRQLFDLIKSIPPKRFQGNREASTEQALHTNLIEIMGIVSQNSQLVSEFFKKLFSTTIKILDNKDQSDELRPLKKEILSKMGLHLNFDKILSSSFLMSIVLVLMEDSDEELRDLASSTFMDLLFSRNQHWNVDQKSIIREVEKMQRFIEKCHEDTHPKIRKRGNQILGVLIQLTKANISQSSSIRLSQEEAEPLEIISLDAFFLKLQKTYELMNQDTQAKYDQAQETRYLHQALLQAAAPAKRQDYEETLQKMLSNDAEQQLEGAQELLYQEVNLKGINTQQKKQLYQAILQFLTQSQSEANDALKKELLLKFLTTFHGDTSPLSAGVSHLNFVDYQGSWGS